MGTGVSGVPGRGKLLFKGSLSIWATAKALSETRFPPPSLQNQPEGQCCVSTSTLGLALRHYSGCCGRVQGEMDWGGTSVLILPNCGSR